MKTTVIFLKTWLTSPMTGINISAEKGKIAQFPATLFYLDKEDRYQDTLCTFVHMYYAGIYNICYFMCWKVPPSSYPYTYRKRHPKVTVPPITIQYLPLKIKIRKIITCPEPVNLKIHSFPLDTRFIDISFVTGPQHF